MGRVTFKSADVETKPDTEGIINNNKKAGKPYTMQFWRYLHTLNFTLSFT